uniref:Uncharacterized protein n=2 Tax=Tetranychus urticae TaxID=32264 RepID=T1KTV5_TETUR
MICESTVNSQGNIQNVNKQNIDAMANNFRSEINLMSAKATQSRVSVINDVINRANLVRDSISQLINSMFNNVNTVQNSGLNKINNDVRSNLTNSANELRALLNRQLNECQHYLRMKSEYSSETWNLLQQQYNQIVVKIDQIHQQKAQTVDQVQNYWLKNIELLRANLNRNLNEMYKIVSFHSDWMVDIMKNWESKNSGNMDEISKHLTTTESALEQRLAGESNQLSVELYNEWINEMNKLITKSEADVKETLESINAFFNNRLVGDKERTQIWHSFHLEDVYYYDQQLQMSVSALISLIIEEVDLIQLEVAKLCTNL